MQRISNRTVELTDDEMARWERFHRLMDHGQTLPFAAKLALNHPGERVSIDFMEWLSEGSVTWRGERFVERQPVPEAQRCDSTFGSLPCHLRLGHDGHHVCLDWRMERSMKMEPRSIGGDLNVSRRCFGSQHERCTGVWTQYPDEAGACECNCHGARS